MSVSAVTEGPNHPQPPPHPPSTSVLRLYFSAFGIGSDSWPPGSTLAGLCPSLRNPLSWDGATVKSPSVLQMALLRGPSPPQTSTITLLHKQAYISQTAARPGPPTVALLLCPAAFYIICASGTVLFSFFSLFFSRMQPLNVKQRSVCEPCVGPRATLTTFTHAQSEQRLNMTLRAETPHSGARRAFSRRLRRDIRSLLGRPAACRHMCYQSVSLLRAERFSAAITEESPTNPSSWVAWG